MPHLTTDDGVKLYFEETGTGAPIVFVHEFAGDHRSWEPQVRYFARHYRCITYNARGYPPSDVPEDIERYSQDRARDDVRSVLDALKIDKAHIIGLSMGGFATVHFGMAYPNRARSLVIAGCGYGASPDQRQSFADNSEAAAKRFDTLPMRQACEAYSVDNPTRVQLENKDPRSWAEFLAHMGEHSPRGCANTLRGVQKRRPSLFDLVDKLKAVTVPALIMTGDEDWACLEPDLMMKRAIATAGLVVMPNCGHAINLEDPDEFNHQVERFLHAVELGKWPKRDPRAMVGVAITR